VEHPRNDAPNEVYAAGRRHDHRLIDTFVRIPHGIENINNLFFLFYSMLTFLLILYKPRNVSNFILCVELVVVQLADKAAPLAHMACTKHDG
jgi:hypothetical protein